MSSDYVLGTVLGSRETAVNKTMRFALLAIAALRVALTHISSGWQVLVYNRHSVTFCYVNPEMR